MKKILIAFLGFALSASLPIAAQSNASGHKSLGQRISGLWHKTRKNVTNAGKELDSALGITETEDVVKVDGVYYMPLYSVNLYDGADGQPLREACKKLFTKRYPQAVIKTVALPQTGWFSSAMEKKGQIVGYMQTMLCYVIARDGSDGYINARFSFKRYKDVGEAYAPLNGSWPKWERTDVLTNKVYSKLIGK